MGDVSKTASAARVVRPVPGRILFQVAAGAAVFLGAMAWLVADVFLHGAKPAAGLPLWPLWVGLVLAGVCATYRVYEFEEESMRPGLLGWRGTPLPYADVQVVFTRAQPIQLRTKVRFAGRTISLLFYCCGQNLGPLRMLDVLARTPAGRLFDLRTVVILGLWRRGGEVLKTRPPLVAQAGLLAAYKCLAVGDFLTARWHMRRQRSQLTGDMCRDWVRLEYAFATEVRWRGLKRAVAACPDTAAARYYGGLVDKGRADNPLVGGSMPKGWPNEIEASLGGLERLQQGPESD